MDAHPARALATVAVVVGTMISGCSGSDEVSRDAPQGFVRTSTELISFAYPRDWEKLPNNAYPKGWKEEYGRGVQGSRGARVAVYTQLPNSKSARLAIEGAHATDIFEDAQVKRTTNRSVDVATASDAWRMEYTYIPTNAPPGMKAFGSEVAVVNENREVALLRVTHAGSLSNRKVAKIIESIIIK